MATMYWLGNNGGQQSATAQVVDVTPANVQIGDVFTLTVTGEDGVTTTVAFTATAATVANVTAGLTAAWNNSTHALCTPVTATDNTTKLTLTADVAGVPFYVAGSTTDGGGANTQTLSTSTITANRGAGDWNTAANWSGGAVPAGSDTVVIDGRGAAAITYGLNQSGVTLASLVHHKSFGFAVGTVAAALRVSATSLQVNVAPNNGSSPSGALFNIDTGSNATTAQVWSSASGVSGLAAVQISGNHASNALIVYGGSVGVCAFKPAITGQFSTIDVRGGTVEVGAGVTLATLTNNGGTAITNAAVTTVNQIAGTFVSDGTGAITTLNADGGACRIGNRPGGAAVVTLNWNGAAMDFTEDVRAVTITTTNVKKGGSASLFKASQVTWGTISFDATNGTSLTLAAQG